MSRKSALELENEEIIEQDLKRSEEQTQNQKKQEKEGSNMEEQSQTKRQTSKIYGKSNDQTPFGVLDQPFKKIIDLQRENQKKQTPFQNQKKQQNKSNLQRENQKQQTPFQNQKKQQNKSNLQRENQKQQTPFQNQKKQQNKSNLQREYQKQQTPFQNQKKQQNKSNLQRENQKQQTPFQNQKKQQNKSNLQRENQKGQTLFQQKNKSNSQRENQKGKTPYPQINFSILDSKIELNQKQKIPDSYIKMHIATRLIDTITDLQAQQIIPIIKKFSKISCSNHLIYIALQKQFLQGKINKINLLGIQGVQKTIINPQLFLENKLQNLYQIISAIKYVHIQGYCFYPQRFHQILYVQKLQNKKLQYQLAIHHCKPQKSEILKQKVIDVPQSFIKQFQTTDFRQTDIWIFGLFVLQYFWNYNCKNEISSLKNFKIGQQRINLITRNSIIKQFKQKDSDIEVYLLDLIYQCLNINPKERKTAEKISLELFQLIENNKIFNSQTYLSNAKNAYLKQQKSLQQTFFNMKNYQAILSLETKNKFIQYFKKQQNRTIKQYQLIYKASLYKFSSRKFHQYCDNRRQILVLILLKGKNKKYICGYSEQAWNLKKVNGVFGSYIKDIKCLSFLYSSANNQFYKLIVPEKAIGINLVTGPVFGAGDLVILDKAVHNFSQYPVSYENKPKKFMKQEIFEIQEYDIYQLTF